MTKSVYLRRHIMVKGRFIDLILQGKKNSTIRLGKVIPKHNEIIIHGGGKPIAKARIKNVIYKKVKELTQEDAIKDGYSSVNELIKDLERVYNKKINPDDIVTIIEFEIIQKFTDLNPEDVYLGLDPIDIARIAYRYLRKELSDEEKLVLESLLRHRSIREVSLRLYGTLNKRWIIRKVLRRCLKRLIEKGILKVDEEKLKKVSALMPYISTTMKNSSISKRSDKIT